MKKIFLLVSISSLSIYINSCTTICPSKQIKLVQSKNTPQSCLMACKKIANVYQDDNLRIKKASSNNPLFVLKVSDKEIKEPCMDYQNKTFQEKLDHPDICSMLEIPYTVGYVQLPVKDKNNDPGRIRHNNLLRAIYGAIEKEVQKNLVFVNFLGKKILFNKKHGAAQALADVNYDLTKLIKTNPKVRDYLQPKNDKLIIETWMWRPIARTERLSPHSFGIAIDIYHQSNIKNTYWQWVPSATQKSFNIPYAIVKTFEKHNFIWGGKWYHFDTMHFEYRPEYFK